MKVSDQINSTSPVTAALGLVDLGFFIVPMCPGTGCTPECPEKKHGKHPLCARGTSAASRDFSTISQWYRRWPNASVGIVHGPQSKSFVVDVDGDEGRAALELLEQKHGKLPDTLDCITSRGRHLYFRHPGSRVNSRSLAKCLDIKGDNGVSVAPPSIHKSGHKYKWAWGGRAEIAEAPAWLIALVTAEPAEIAEVAEETLKPVVEKPVTPEGTQTAEVLKRTSFDARKEACKAMYFMPVNVNEILADPELKQMDGEQSWWYVCLILEAWKAAGTLEDRPETLWKLARASNRALFESKSAPVIAAFETASDSDGRPILIHHATRELWREKHTEKDNLHETRQRSGSMGGKAKAAKRKGLKVVA
jgi:Bifunctional DNA primase/polymerase, N-terminal